MQREASMDARLASIDRRLDMVFTAIDSLPDRIYQRLHEAKDHDPVRPKADTITLTMAEFTQALMQASMKPCDRPSASSSVHSLVEQHIQTSLRKDVVTTSGNSSVHIDNTSKATPTTSMKSMPSPTSFDMLIESPRSSSNDVAPHDLISATESKKSLSLPLIVSTDTTRDTPLLSLSRLPSPQTKKRKIRPSSQPYPPLSNDVHFLRPLNAVLPVTPHGNSGCDDGNPDDVAKTKSRRHAPPPPQWRCHATLCKTMWVHWYRGDAANRVGPFRFLKLGADTDAQSRRLFRRGRKLMHALERVVLSSHWVESADAIAALPTSKFAALFEKAFGTFLGRTPHGTLTRPGFELVRADQVAFYMYSTVVDIMTKAETCGR
ncbi:hypothetical protein DYB37_007165 [Aphanomyces astaci]|uniref:Uncharacterized protein n=1 Tax=Aphanomyces astaci TaxID=112090 RepID=A0A3R6WGU2_APHAT|nr:hypothetical protein DYB35_006223 [Aphanomyces astaci]RHZ12129.1 hypothetical protein DYB37_007165 [Aphanomyces astaci]